MSDWKNIKAEILKDSQVQKLYNELEMEYQLVEKIIEIRQKKGWTQLELAKKVGTTQSAIARVESGKFNPKLDFLKKLASAFDSRLIVDFK